MKIETDHIVGEVVAQDYRTAAVFHAHGIDFCCKGGRSIADACERKDVEPHALVEALQKVVEQNESKATDYNSWPLDLLADYIEKKHHRYVENRILEIKPFLHKVATVHGGRHPELLEVAELFDQTSDELTVHMKKEEFVLFPFIRKMVSQKAANQPISTPPFGTVQNPIEMMKHDHNAEGERFQKITELTGNFVPPADACRTYTVTYAMLKEFAEDLYMHIHLENNILFPKAIEMERQN
ncbi:MAG: iron-sulfur cluster repair di-iron protein [Bacteroidota bacterium]|nr:MAG: iron-sulfur cluster repair di-iron protein [Bacteroidetes bacterium OLB12]GIL22348.1 MAG: iron-sulfur cluster repair di-iron protein [Bacteroidota bacterium]HNU43062.1 iron-sulfur cluster repair di-iron protein [Cyclobacteriaceae bacterium]